MTADRATASYSFPRLLAFTRTRTFIAIAAFIAGANIGFIIASYENRQALHVLDARIDAAKAQFDSLKRQSGQQK
jgi:uncharacterized membrane-anchored protein YhcB (DUF1043 family)